MLNQVQEVLVLSQNTIVLFGIKSILEALPIQNRISCARDIVEFQERLNVNNYDLMILDYNPFQKEEWKWVKNVAKLNRAKIVIFNEFANLPQIKELYKMGINGYINMAADTSEITVALSMILQGGRYLSHFDFVHPKRLMTYNI